ncbi:MAG TPA: hypothetical protein VF771_19720 [Longimicrobiaceae bacterium]
MDRETEIEFLRDALRRHVEKTSVRQVAEEVGMSHGGVHNFVYRNVMPYGKTLAKLREWYVEQSTHDGNGMKVEVALYVIDQMLASVPASVRAGAGVELLDTLVELHGKFGVPVPPWVDHVREDLRAEAKRKRPPQADAG